MESLAHYGSDDESGDYNESSKNDNRSRRRVEEDTNYDEIGMDESSEESNNNHAEGHFQAGRERRFSGDGRPYQDADYRALQYRGGGYDDSYDNASSTFGRDQNRKYDEDHNSCSTGYGEHGQAPVNWQPQLSEVNRSFDGDNSYDSAHGRRREEDQQPKYDQDERKVQLLGMEPEERHGRRHEGDENFRAYDNSEYDKDPEKAVSYPGDYGGRKSEEVQRRHSSDMEMDDGEDELDNYVNNVNNEHGKVNETTEDFRQKFAPKHLNFARGKPLGDQTSKTSSSYHSQSRNNSENSSTREQKDYHKLDVDERRFPPRHDDYQKSREERLKEWEKQREQKGKEYDHRKDEERKLEENERRKEEHKRKEDKDDRKNERRDSDERWRDGERDRDRDRDRKRESDKHREERVKDRDRKRSPDRRDYGKKRSHSPDRRDRDRDYDRERDRDHRSSDRRSPKHSRRNSRSPERSWKARKLEKKTAVLNKLGIELKPDATGNMTPRQLLGEQLKTQIQEVEAKTGVTLPTYYNPGVMNPLKYAQQIQKRKLLWGNKAAENKGAEASQAAPPPIAVKQWEAATFKGDNDGRMTEKFKRLMGIKGDSSSGNVNMSVKPPETKEIIQKQEEMFSNMEAQYQVARMATHTHRGVGLGFGTFQVPPR